MEGTLRGKVALIAGGSGGIGAATAKLLAARGALVIVNYLKNEAAAQRVVAEIHANRQLARAVQADVREPEHVKMMVENILEENERIDIMIDSVSSFAFVKPFAEMTWDEFIWGVQNELLAAFELTRAVLPIMQKQRYGRLVYVGSGLAKAPTMPGSISIATGKAGLGAFVRSIAREYGPYGITANVVSPGMVETELSSHMPAAQKQRVTSMTPLGRIAQPEDIARAIAFFASDDSGFLTGTSMPVNGGLSME
jgi:3-oxoacyl-[acyl-carrier protein] reductase